MTAAVLIVPILWCAAAGGAQVNRWLRAAPVLALPLERRLFGLATGLVLLAYVVLALGLIGMFSAGPILAACLLFGIVGVAEHRPMAADLFGNAACLRKSVAGSAAFLLFVLFGTTSLIGCFTPPISIEWDSLSYHLADPKIYLHYHRIVPLPWESHSNFAFTMEMLYAIGLSVHSIALAKLFHLTTAIIAVAATYLIGRRFHSSTLGLLSALLFASLPIVFWEAGTAYVDLGATAFGALSLLALGAALTDADCDSAWLRASSLMLACMISVKATSLVTAALFSLALFIFEFGRHRNAAKAVLTASGYAGMSLAGGCVWYVKSWVVTGNPFFPFAYSVFGGRHWSAANALNYSQSQAVFGAGHRLSDLLLAPWNLILYLLPRTAVPADVTKPFNDYQTYLVSLTPLFLAALFFPPFWKRRPPPAILALAIYSFASFVIWFYLTQQVRYLLPALPVFCILTASVLLEANKTTSISRTALSALLAASLLFSCTIATMLIKSEYRVAFGLVSSQEYAMERFDAYPVMEFLNTETPMEDGVVFYGEPRDYYCDRRYMWGEPNHGLVIPYGTMSTPPELRMWLLNHGYQYIVINYNEAAIGPGPGMNGLLYGITAGSSSGPLYAYRGIAVYRM